jgi:calmodulin
LKVSFIDIIFVILFNFADGNGDIDFEEFVAVMSRKVDAAYSPNQVRSAFKVFEIPGHAGYIKAEALVKALCTYGAEKLTEAQAKDLVSQMESDAAGYINYGEYINMMMSG